MRWHAALRCCAVCGCCTWRAPGVASRQCTLLRSSMLLPAHRLCSVWLSCSHCHCAALKRVLAQAEEQHGLTIQLGYGERPHGTGLALAVVAWQLLFAFSPRGLLESSNALLAGAGRHASHHNSLLPVAIHASPQSWSFTYCTSLTGSSCWTSRQPWQQRPRWGGRRVAASRGRPCCRCPLTATTTLERAALRALRRVGATRQAGAAPGCMCCPSAAGFPVAAQPARVPAS